MSKSSSPSKSPKLNTSYSSTSRKDIEEEFGVDFSKAWVKSTDLASLILVRDLDHSRLYKTVYGSLAIYYSSLGILMPEDSESKRSIYSNSLLSPIVHFIKEILKIPGTEELFLFGEQKSNNEQRRDRADYMFRLDGKDVLPVEVKVTSTLCAAKQCFLAADKILQAKRTNRVVYGILTTGDQFRILEWRGRSKRNVRMSDDFTLFDKKFKNYGEQEWIDKFSDSIVAMVSLVLQALKAPQNVRLPPEVQCPTKDVTPPNKKKLSKVRKLLEEAFKV